MKKNDKAMKRDYNGLTVFPCLNPTQTIKQNQKEKKNQRDGRTVIGGKKNCWRKIFEKRKLAQILKRKNYHN
jgi:hypothetical protein